MKRTLIRYKTKPDMADRNAELIAGVFAELKAASPAGVRYLSLRLDDDTFVHFVETESDSGSTISALDAFKAFQSGIRERCIEPPQPGSATIVGNYRMLAEPLAGSFGREFRAGVFRKQKGIAVKSIGRYAKHRRPAR
ncbi:MAG: hypothetical protein JWP51_5422, partial [Bradyrhizobium sp.]|nr:hypothetical protein [Bradyrhizobium sp.]